MEEHDKIKIEFEDEWTDDTTSSMIKSEKNDTGYESQTKSEKSDTGYESQTRSEKSDTGYESQTRSEKSDTGYESQSKSEKSDTGYESQSSCKTQCEGWSNMFRKTSITTKNDFKMEKQKQNDSEDEIDIENTDEDDIDIDTVIPCDLNRINQWRLETFQLLEKTHRYDTPPKQKKTIIIFEQEGGKKYCLQKRSPHCLQTRSNLERKRRRNLAKMYLTLLKEVSKSKENSPKIQILQLATNAIKKSSQEEKELILIKSNLKDEIDCKINRLKNLPVWKFLNRF